MQGFRDRRHNAMKSLDHTDTHGHYDAMKLSIRRTESNMQDQSKTSASLKGRIFGTCFSSVFIAIGLIVPWFTFVTPLRLQLAARNWAIAPATVTESRVQTHSDSDGSTYSVYIAYTYSYQGQTHRGDRYTFLTGSSSGRSKKQAVVRNYPKGRRFDLYVDPTNPRDSVIKPNAGAAIYLGLIPLVFAVFGAIFLIAVLKGNRSAKTYGKQRRKNGHHRDGDLETVFKPSNGHLGRILGTLFAALFWNGIVSVFVVDIIKDWTHGRKPIGSSLFISIFVIIGVAIIGGFIYQILRVFNPSLRIDAPPAIITPGSSLALPFRVIGRTSKLSSLTLTLKGEERATYRRGTDTHTDTRTFFRKTLYETGQGMVMDSGSFTLALPVDAMHSFKSSNNEVRWYLEIHGNIPRWPDLAESVILNVVPKEVQS